MIPMTASSFSRLDSAYNMDDNGNFQLSRYFDSILRLLVLVVLFTWTVEILSPFLLPAVWGIILAVASYPLFETVLNRSGGRRGIAAVAVSMMLLLIIIVPGYFLVHSLFTGMDSFGPFDQDFKVPPPTEAVKEWPLIGDRVYSSWLLASENLGEAIKPIIPQLKEVAKKGLEMIAGLGFALLQFIFSIIICGIFLANAESSTKAVKEFAVKLSSDRGIELLHDAEVTVRNVARGIVGVALIQAILAGIGFAMAGIPAPGLWALLALVLGVIQIGVGPVMIVATIYLFSTTSGMVPVLFLIWSLIVGPLDNILKPILLGRGAPVPMLVIFLGSLGGFLQSGIIGLFVGAIVLSLAYKLLITWLHSESDSTLPVDGAV